MLGSAPAQRCDDCKYLVLLWIPLVSRFAQALLEGTIDRVALGTCPTLPSSLNDGLIRGGFASESSIVIRVRPGRLHRSHLDMWPVVLRHLFCTAFRR